MKTEHFIYKGKIGIYVVTGKVLLAFHGNTWSAYKDYTQSEWAMVDLVKAQRICELELLVLTGTSIEEVEQKIIEAQGGNESESV